MNEKELRDKHKKALTHLHYINIVIAVFSLIAVTVCVIYTDLIEKKINCAHLEEESTTHGILHNLTDAVINYIPKNISAEDLYNYEHIIAITIITTLVFLIIFSKFTSHRLNTIHSELDNLARAETVLNQIQSLLRNSPSAKTGFQNCLDFICKELNWPIGHVYSVNNKDPDNIFLEPDDMWYLEDTENHTEFHQETMKTTFKKGEGLPGQVLENDEPIWIKDISKTAHPRAKLGNRVGIHTGFAIPIKQHDKIFAIMEFFSTDIKKEDPENINIISHIAIPIGVFLEQRLAEEKLQKNESLLTAIFENLIDAIITVNKNGEILTFSRAAEKIFGYKGREASQKKLFDILSFEIKYSTEEEALKFLLAEQDKKENKLGIQLKAIHKNNSKFPTNISLSKSIMDDKTVFTLVIRDITEQLKIEQDLIKSQNDALYASKAKGEFLARMSHEIRTPMNGIIGTASLLEQTQLDDKQNKYLKTISSSGNSLLMILNEILDHSKIEAGMLEISNEPFEIHSCLEDTYNLFSTLAEEKQIIFEFTSEDLPEFIIGDAGRIRQVITNFVSNALKFTQEEGIIQLNASVKEQTNSNAIIEFAVSDSGMGVPKDKQAALFDAFSQADTSSIRSAGGTGLGLSITKHITELMDGEIGVDSIEGQGSTFWVRIPFDIPKESAIIHLRQDKIKTDSNKKNTLFKAHILVAEDVAVNRFVIQEMLEGYGITLDLAHDGIEAVEKAEKGEYDLIFMDIHMPRMDGLTATEEIRNSGNKTTIVALTANVIAAEQEKCFKAGMDDFLAKPVTRDSLFEILNKWTQKQGEKEKPVGKKQTEYKEQKSEKPETHGKILLVDGDDASVFITQGLLNNLNFTVDICSSAPLALSSINDRFYDLVLVSKNIPETHIIKISEAAKKKTDDNHTSPPLIITNVEKEDNGSQICSKVQAYDYMPTPISSEKIIETLESWGPVSNIGRESDKDEFQNMGHYPINYEAFSDFGESYQKIIDMSIKHTDELMEQIEKEREEGKNKELAFILHSMKSVTAQIGARKLSILIQELEDKAENDDMSDTDDLFTKMHSEYTIAKETLLKTQ